MSVVICKLPRAGLGNQLFPLMRAYTFAHLNKLPVFVTNYHQLKIGPWLRGEKNKRNYRGFFKFQKNIISAWMENILIKKYKFNELVNEPEVRKRANQKECFYFSTIPHYTKFFEGLNENRQLMIELLWQIITPATKKKVNEHRKPCIGVHIRMGDFRKLKDKEEFGKVGTVRTPQEYFIETIISIRTVHGSDLPVSIFTDGKKSELKELLELNNVHLIERNSDIVDLILLSTSKIIIVSAGSTFSYWAGFISEAPIIMHPKFANIKIRPENVWDTLYEGALDINNEKLSRIIKQIRC